MALLGIIIFHICKETALPGDHQTERWGTWKDLESPPVPLGPGAAIGVPKLPDTPFQAPSILGL